MLIFSYAISIVFIRAMTAIIIYRGHTDRERLGKEVYLWRRDLTSFLDIMSNLQPTSHKYIYSIIYLY